MKNRTPRRALVALGIVAIAIALLLVWKGRRLYEVFVLTQLQAVTVAPGLDLPWSMAFLPDGRMLVSERPGRMRLVTPAGAVSEALGGLPAVWAEAGLLGVAVDPKFAENQWVYWSYGEPAPKGETGGSNAVARGRLEGNQLHDVQVIFRDPLRAPDSHSLGSRLAFGPDGRLFVTIGDRGRRDDVQRLDRFVGKVLRIEADGGIPSDNPFIDTPGALPQIWALGFRDPQGIVVDSATGRVWLTDHGPEGGDEVNLLQRGHNYGWPVVTYGCEDGTCARIGEGREKAGMDPAAIWWDEKTPMPVTAVAVLKGDRYPGWQGQLLVGVLHGQALLRLEVDGERLIERERMFVGRPSRVRDVQQGPDGWLYLVTNNPDGRIVRLED